MSDAEDFILTGEQALEFLEAEINGLRAQILLLRGMLQSAEDQFVELEEAIEQGHEIEIRVMKDDGSLDT